MRMNESGIWLPETPSIFVKPTEEIISQRKLEGLKKLSEIKQWGLRNPTKFMERFIGVELLDVQNYTFMNSWDKMYALWVCTRNYGKALALDTPIPTPDGYKAMGDLKIGDYVFDRNKKPTKIISTSPIFENHICFKILFDDGETIVSDADHLWRATIYDSFYSEEITIDTQSIYSLFKSYNFIIPGYKQSKKIKDIYQTLSVKTKCISVDNPEHLYLCGTHDTVTHNSTLLALYFMTRGMLLNNCRAYICAGTSDQSIETFEKIVSIAKNEIESFTGLTDVFKNEVVINMNNSDGFIRNPAGFTYRLYNGSFVKTLNSNVNAKRGISNRNLRLFLF